MNMTIAALTQVRETEFKGKKFKFICNPEEWHPSWFSFQDELTVRERWWNPGPGDLILDIGADFGSYTLSALAHGASVIAWSPPFKDVAPLEAYALRTSAWLNHFEEQLILFESGLWSKRGWMAGMDGPRPAQVFDTREEAVAAIAGQPGYCTTFPVCTLDSMGIVDMVASKIHEDGNPPMTIKIDTEGCEPDILIGASEIIETYKPRIILENHYHIRAGIEDEARNVILGMNIGYVSRGTVPYHSISHTLYEIE